MPKPFSKRGFKVKLALLTLFRYENSVQSCFFTICILRPITPDKMKTAYVDGKFHGNQ